MKMTITEFDVNKLTGKFILQVNSDDPDMSIDDKNWSFVKEKRLKFVCGLTLVGFYDEHRKCASKTEFVEYFNNYLPNAQKERFHRLLTSKEIDFVASKLKESNY